MILKNENIAEIFRYYQKTNNPLYAWEIIRKAIEIRREWEGLEKHLEKIKLPDEIEELKHGLQLPEQVEEYLLNVAQEIIKTGENPPKAKDRPIALARALKLHKDNAGAGSAYSEFSDFYTQRNIAIDTFESLEKWGLGKFDYAFEEISEMHNISKSTARRNFERFTEIWIEKRKNLEETGEIYNNENNELVKETGGDKRDLIEGYILLSIYEHPVFNNCGNS